MNRSPINGAVLGAGKNASFALILLRQAHELVGQVRLTVTKYLSFNQTHEATATIPHGRRLAMGFVGVQEHVVEVAFRVRKRVLLAFLGRAEHNATVMLRLYRSLAFSTSSEHTASVTLRAMHPAAIAFDQTHEHVGEMALQDIYTGSAPSNRSVGVGSFDRATAVSGSDNSTGA